MTRILRSRASIGLSLVAVGVGLLPFFVPSAIRAIKPDIPRIQAGAERGSIEMEIELGAAYFVGRGVERDEKRAAYWYEKAANSGDAIAQKQIGYFYQVGIGVPRDPVRAVRWFERAVAGGLVSAKVNLGVAYLWGLGVQKDEAESAQLFQEAAAKGDGLGACYLGDMHYFGRGVPKDESAAKHWYETGAKLHDPLALYRLGVLLSTNQSHMHELQKAAESLRESVKSGYIPAKHALGLLLVRRPELTSSPQEAISLLEDASAAGLWRSSVTLAVLARDGRGMPLDKKSAYYHFQIAKLQGGEVTSRLIATDLRILAAELGTKQTEAVDSDAAAWFQKHPASLQFIFKDGDSWKKFPLFAIEFPEGDVHAGRIVATPPS